MKEHSKLREWIFRLWALLLKSLFWTAPLMLTSMLLQGRYGWSDFGFDFAMLLSATALGCAAGYFRMWFERRHPQTENDQRELPKTFRQRIHPAILMEIVIFAVGIFILLAASVLLRGRFDYGLLAGAFLTVCWVRAVLSVNKPYSSLYSLREYVAVSVTCLVCILCVYFLDGFQKSTFDTTPLFVTFIFMTASTGILLNQLNLDQTMERMSYNKAALPKKIRLYNVLLIGGMMTLLVVGFLFRKELGGFIATVWEGIVYGILWVIFWILSFSKDPKQNEPLVLPEGPNVQGSDMSWFLIVLFVVVGLVLVFLLFQYGWLIKNVLIKLFHWTPRGSWRFGRKQVKSTYYTDLIEDLLPDEEQRGSSIDKRYFRRSLKSWRKLTDPAEKVRKGYGLLLRYAEQSREDVTCADTVAEIKAKTAGERYGFALEHNSEAYEEVRYSGRFLSPEDEKRLYADVEMVFSKIRH